jgi:fibronectin type 3 domain-containing protein
VASPTPTPTPTPQGGFWVYRRTPDSAYRRPLTPAPVAAPPLRDTSIAPGERWCYVVRTVASTEPVVESASSSEACVENRDVFPPAAPTGVAVLVRDDAVEVSWSPSLEADLAGYRVYRSADGAPPSRLAELPAADTVYRDAAAPRGAALVYTVGAFDRDGNESPPSAGVETRRP